MSEFLANRKEDWEQLKYLAKHKKDVYTTGLELDVPRMQLLLHDRTKFRPKNWVPYREYWFGDEGAYANNMDRDAIPKDKKDNFRTAVKDHFSSEDHHMHKNPKNVPMDKVPLNTRKEMLSDWYAVSSHMSDNPLPPVKEWADSQGYTNMYKKSSLLKQAISEKRVLDAMAKRLAKTLRKTNDRGPWGDEVGKVMALGDSKLDLMEARHLVQERKKQLLKNTIGQTGITPNARKRARTDVN